MALNLPFKNLWNQIAKTDTDVQNQSVDHPLNKTNFNPMEGISRKEKTENNTFKRKFRKRLLWRLFPNSKIRELVKLLEDQDVNLKVLLDESAIITLIDTDGKIEFVNKRFCDLFDYSENEILQNPFSSLFMRKTHSSCFNSIWQTVNHGNVWKGEIRNISQQEHKLWLYSIVIPILDTNQKPIKFLNISHNITKEKEAKTHSTFFMKMLEHVSDAIQVADIEGNLIYANQAALKLHNCSYEYLISRKVMDFEPLCKDKNAWKKHVDELRIKRNMLVETEYTNIISGVKIPVEVSANHLTVEDKEFIVATIRNISNRKQKENLKKETDLRTEYLLTNLHDLVTIVDNQGLIQYQSPGIKTKLGIEAKDVLKTTFTDLLIEEDKTRFEKLLSQRTNNDENYFSLSSTQKSVLVEITLQDKLTDPIVKGIIITCRDVTEIQKNIIALERQKELYKLLSDNNRDLICLHKHNGDYLFLSNSVQEMLGFKPTELIGTSPYAMIHEKDVEKVLQEARKNNTKGLFQNKFQYRLRKKDGGYVWVESITKPIFDENGNCIKLQSSTRDITNKVLSELALKQSDKKYRELIKYSQALITSHDAEGRFTSVNPVFTELLGYSASEVIGKRISTFIPKHHIPAFRKNYIGKLQSEGSVKGIMKMINKKGDPVYLHYHNFKVTEEGLNNSFTGIAIDVTEQIKYEKALKEAKEKAEEAVNAKEIFLANMSHEIRTPLNGILGMSDLLKKSFLNEEQKTFNEIIQNSGKSLLVIINDILDLAKLESGKFKLESTTFNLCDSVLSSIKPLIYKAEEQDLKLEVNLPCDETLDVVGDPYRLNQIVTNLLNNAIKFTPKGSVTLSGEVIKENNKEIEIRFNITDTGIGIENNRIGEIFENFHQIEGTHYTKSGTGLGLPICNKLIEMMGGEIRAESKPGLGSTFYFQLKLPKGKLSPKKPKQQIQLNPELIKDKKILIAEDNKVNQLLVESILKSWQVNYKTANDGEEALQLFENEDFDLILLDIQMPKLSGLDVIELIRNDRNKQKAKTPVIALTANAFKGQKQEYLDAGMDNYLSKPFNEDGLLTVIFETLKVPKRAKSGTKKLISQNTVNTDNTNTQSNSSMMVNFKMDNLKEITGNDDELMKQILNLFIDTVPVTLGELKTAIQNRDWNEAGAKAHKLKGSVVTVDAQPTTQILVTMEKDLKDSQNLEDIHERYTSLENQIDEIIAQMKTMT